ncbi:hypothetical protein [Deinococcus radiophilus]|uniref:hypothetical protein n=1 Tax=Deinococcus radiophilus TaxID=32062 RepID=UPI003612B3D1
MVVAPLLPVPQPQPVSRFTGRAVSVSGPSSPLSRIWPIPSRPFQSAPPAHTVEPEGAAPFCTLRPVDTPHPFAALAGLSLPDGD